MKLSMLGLMTLLLAGPALAAFDDLETSFENLKTIAAQKDPAQVKKAATEACTLVQAVLTAKAPDGDAESWKARVAYAKEVDLYAGYAIYSTAVGASPEVTVDLFSTLEQISPKNMYMGEGYGAYFVALRQTGATAKIQGIAEKAIQNQPDSEDLLLFLADAAMNKQQYDKASGYAERLVVVLKRHGKPETLTVPDWEKKRTGALGAGYWMAGMVHSQKQQYPQADEDLRAALPLIQSNPGLLAPALFHLSLANYQLGKLTMNRGRVLEGAAYAEKVAAMKTDLAQQAWTNAHLMRQEATKMARGGR